MTNIDSNLDRLGDALHRAAKADLDSASAVERTPAAKTPRPSWRRRGPRLAFGGAVALAAVAAALLVSAGDDSTSSAYAVEPLPGGGVKVDIYNLSDPQGVEKALEDAGINSQVNYLDAGMTCREPHYHPSMAVLRTLQDHQQQPQPWAGFNYESSDGPLTIAVGDYQQRKQMDEEIREAYRQGDRSLASYPEFIFDPNGFKPNQTLIISSAPTPAGYQQPVPDPVEGVHVTPGQAQIDTVGQVRVAEGEVGPCEPVPASDGEAPIRAPEGGWDFSQTPYAGWGFGPGPTE